MNSGAKEEGRASDPLQTSQTDTDTKASVPKPSYMDFEPFPRAVAEARKGGLLDRNEFYVLCFLIGDINWQTKQWHGSLAVLAEYLDWESTHDYLRKTLVSLRSDRWIDYDLRPGERYYTIRLGERIKWALEWGTNAALADLLGTTSDLTSDKGQTGRGGLSLTFPQTADAASVPPSPDLNGHRGVSQPQTLPSPYTETDTETIRDDSETPQESRRELSRGQVVGGDVRSRIETAMGSQPAERRP